ncbi:carbohydrate esterase family 4 protein [Pholiota molesta]|nr:carbohydrate esterase family 4 protein [Pholiota molesta]
MVSSILLTLCLRRALATVYSKCTVPKTVALTFDDGPYIYMNDIVNALGAAGAKGTFSLVHACIYNDDEVKRVKYAYDRGHQLASHTWAHKDLTTLSWDQIHDEMWRVEQALVRITGAYPAFMRPPYGNYNNLVREAAAARGQTLAVWDFDSQDSLGASVATSEKLYTDAISKKPNTILALNHETLVLPFAIQKLQAAGYNLVTLAQCLGKQPYQSVVAPSTRDSSWHC